MWGVKKKLYFNVLMVVVFVCCVGYIILLCYLYYFNMLNVKIKSFDVWCIIKWDIKIYKIVFWVAKNYIFLAILLWMLLYAWKVSWLPMANK